ncbi:MAG: MFS transporter [Jatrophihabitantaceae bacterium]
MKPRSNFIALISADIGSALGSQVSLVAIPWLVLSITGDPTDMGLAVAAEVIPYLLASMLLTPLADRLGLRRSSVCCDLVSALSLAAIALMHGTGLGWLLLLIALTGALRGVGDRTKHVLLRSAAMRAGYPMIRVTSLYEGLSRTSMLIGTSLGGLLIVWFGARGAVSFDAASFAVCALVVGGLVAGQPADPITESAPQERYLVALRGGFGYLRSDRVLSTMLATTFMINFFGNAATTVFIPVWARDVLHSPEALGFTLGAYAAGALAGTVIFTVLADRVPRYRVFLIGALISCAPRLLVVGLSSNLALVMLVSVIAGLGIASVNPILGAAMYERVPDGLQTRVIGLCTTVSFMGIPIGALIGGWAVTRFGLHSTLITAAVICLVINSVPLLDQRRITLGRPVPAEAGRA